MLADQAQKSLSDVPGELDGLGDARELDRPDQLGSTHEFDNLLLCCFERGRVFGTDLDEQGSRFGVERLPVAGCFRESLTGRGECRGDHELDGRGAELDKAWNQGDSFVDRGHGNPCHAGHTRRRYRLYYRFGDEGERALRADQEASKDLERRFTVEECTEPQSVRVPDRVLATRAIRQRRICQELVRSSSNPAASCGSASANSFSASGFEVSMTAPDGVTNVSAETVW